MDYGADIMMSKKIMRALSITGVSYCFVFLSGANASVMHYYGMPESGSCTFLARVSIPAIQMLRIASNAGAHPV